MCSAQIKQLGVWVALDDFGTGYSSLNHIRELPIDVIKIDRCFVVDIGKDDYSEVFVKMVSETCGYRSVCACAWKAWKKTNSWTSCAR